MILVRCYGDGLIEIWAEDYVGVRFVDVPFVEPVDHPVAEAYADLETPKYCRHFKRIHTHWVRPIRPSEIHKREVELAIVRELKGLKT